jgi:hypothetical protein
MAIRIVLPWVHRSFSNLKVWGLGVYHGLRRRHFQSDLDEFVFGAPGMPHSDPCCHRRCAPAPALLDIDLTGTKGIRRRKQKWVLFFEWLETTESV